MIEWLRSLQDEEQVERVRQAHAAQRQARWMADAIEAFDPFQPSSLAHVQSGQ